MALPLLALPTARSVEHEWDELPSEIRDIVFEKYNAPPAPVVVHDNGTGTPGMIIIQMTRDPDAAFLQYDGLARPEYPLGHLDAGWLVSPAVVRAGAKANRPWKSNGLELNEMGMRVRIDAVPAGQYVDAILNLEGARLEPRVIGRFVALIRGSGAQQRYRLLVELLLKRVDARPANGLHVLPYETRRILRNLRDGLAADL